VRKLLPEVNEIQDTDLRERVLEAWAISLAETEFASIDEIPAQATPQHPYSRKAKALSPVISEA